MSDGGRGLVLERQEALGEQSLNSLSNLAFLPQFPGKVLPWHFCHCCPEQCVESLGITLRFSGSVYGSLESWGGVLGGGFEGLPSHPEPSLVKKVDNQAG